MKRQKVFNFVRGLMLLFFLGVLLYPSISDYVGKLHTSSAMQSYDEEVKGIDEQTKKDLLEKARQYNQSLVGSSQVFDPFSDEGQENNTYLQQLSFMPSGMMGYIQIPKLDIKLGIYHGTDNGVLQKGVGHLEGSSLPIGGESTHCVLSGHRGLPSSKLFTDLDQMTEGDIFYITVLNETLAYQVVQIKTVLPNEMDDIQIVEGEDYVTLVTCTPYSVNTHRLLVRGKRIDYSEAIKEAPNEVKTKLELSFEVKIALIAFLIILIGILKLKRGKGNE